MENRFLAIWFLFFASSALFALIFDFTRFYGSLSGLCAFDVIGQAIDLLDFEAKDYKCIVLVLLWTVRIRYIYIYWLLWNETYINFIHQPPTTRIARFTLDWTNRRMLYDKTTVCVAWNSTLRKVNWNWHIIVSHVMKHTPQRTQKPSIQI